MKKWFLPAIFLVSFIFPVMSRDGIVLCVEKDGQVKLENSYNGKCTDAKVPIAIDQIHCLDCQVIPLLSQPQSIFSPSIQKNIFSVVFVETFFDFETVRPQLSYLTAINIVENNAIPIFAFHS